MSVKAARAASPKPDRRQRRHPRYRCNFPVIVTLFSDNGYRQVDAHCKDLSVAGIGFILAAELTPGEIASLKFSLPESHQQWDVKAILRHRRGYHYGFEFLSLSKEQKIALLRFFQGLERAD